MPGPDAGDATGSATDDAREAGRLGELARLFLRLGTTAFGGPAAHVAMMEDEVVRRRGWLTPAEFLDLVGATNLIPGPNSTELAIHVGHRRAGWAGLLVAGACFILPAALVVGVLAWLYVRGGTLPAAAAVLYGVKPVVIAVVLQALWRLGRTAVRSWTLALVGAAAVVAVAAGMGEIAVLAAAGLATAALGAMPAAAPGGSATGDGEAPRATLLALPHALQAGGAAGGAAAAATAFGLWPLFLFFAKVGAVLFGSGYVLLAFLRSGLVVERGWLTEPQLLDAIAIGQVTPGPVFTTATFVGYLLGGAPGAVVATLGIFLPAFLFVAASGPLVPRLRRSPTAGRVLDGVNVASLALMLVVSVQLARSALVDVPTVALAAAALGLLAWGRVNSAWLVVGGAVVGYVARG